MKILILADIHTGTSRDSTTHSGIIRQANTQAFEKLTQLIPVFNQKNFDLVVNLGDNLRDTHDKLIDRENLSKTISAIKSIGAETINLLGNHELRSFSKPELAEIYTTTKVKPEFFGQKIVNGVQFIWVDLELKPNKLAYLTANQLDWLNQTLDPELPAVIFSHHSIAPISSTGNFYFDQNPAEMSFENSAEIIKILTGKKVFLAINCHTHMLTNQVKNSVSFNSVLAFSENIAASNYPTNNPAIYSILELEGQKFSLSSYSGEFCFSKIQNY